MGWLLRSQVTLITGGKMSSTMQMRTLGFPSSTRDLGITVTLGGSRKSENLNPKVPHPLQPGLTRAKAKGYFFSRGYQQYCSGILLGQEGKGEGLGILPSTFPA